MVHAAQSASVHAGASASEVPLPDTVPLRGVQQRLSLALERTKMGELEALPDLLAMEQDYRPYITDPEAAAAVLHAMLTRAEIAQLFDKTDEALTIFNNAVELYETHYQGYASDETSASSAISAVLVNKGFRLGALGRSEDAVAVYDEVVARFRTREEVALAEQVAKAHLAKAIVHIQAEESREEGCAVLQEFIDRHLHTTSPALAALVEFANNIWMS